MRIFIVLATLGTGLAGCDGHQYEPKAPGVTLSGEAKAGVKYHENTGTRTGSDLDLKVNIGGSV